MPTKDFNIFVEISKMDTALRVVKGVVYKPNELDSQEEWMAPEDIRKSAYRFMEHLRQHNIDTQHTLEKADAFVCESYIAKADDPDGYPEGSWAVVVQVVDEDLWNKVEKGEYGGFSMYGKSKIRANVDPPGFEGGE